MANREGSLEAPTRHPLDWKNPEFWDRQSCDEELERVFDICHGCRRCVSLCNAFPTLFDLVDDSDTMEVDGVARSDYQKVVDQCYMCDLCYMTKCPYVPPHDWNVDFPHLMLRSKAIDFKAGTATATRDKILSNTALNGKLASIPVVVDVVNAATGNPGLRTLGEKTLGVHHQAWLPRYARTPFARNAAPEPQFPVRDGARTPGKVAVYTTCYVNWNEPGIGHDLLKILAHNEIPACVVESQACCGMPKLELGDLESVARLGERNIRRLHELAQEGHAIVTPVPSCTLMFKQELPLMFPDDARYQTVAAAMFDPFEYLVLRDKDGLLNTAFPQALGNISYHMSCHLRVQNVGQKTREMLEKVPGTQLKVVERCSGHAGTYGVKKEHFDTAMKIGRPVFRQMAEHPGGSVDAIASDCQLAGHHIAQGMGGDAETRVTHPLSLLARAYGL